MTYNFDPDRWLDNELAAIDAKWAAGRLTDEARARLKQEAMARYDDMIDRLDGTYQLPT